jgi:lysophospholipase L1-like esterase
VTANSLGFPGRDYAPEKTPDTYRVFAVGDAFTSAEGVDTEESWPQLLEGELSARLPGKEIQVMDFAITGYGPNQYAAVVKEFVPKYQPDLIVIGFFVNDFEDVLWSDDMFRASIGFGQPDQKNWYSLPALSHFRRFAELRIREPLLEILKGTPRPHGYFLGNYSAFELANTRIFPEGYDRVEERLVEIKGIADETGTQLMLALVPAPIQICAASQLAYAPRDIDLQDATIYDLERPQKFAQRIAEEHGINYVDLAPVLQEVLPECPYRPRNMHWTEAGHAAVARYLADLLAEGVQIAEK